MERKTDTSDRELLLERTLNAPIDIVWEAWTNPDHIANWWGPNGFSNTISKMDFKVGGEWNLVMLAPDGTNYDNRSIFEEIIPLKKIVYKHISQPLIIATIDFEDLGEKTGLRWHMLFESADVFKDVAQKYGAEEGQKQNVEKLNVYVEQMLKRKK